MSPSQETPGRDPLFKGLTRPAMLFGVPLVPLLLGAGGGLLLCFWVALLVSFSAAMFLLVGVLPLFLWMRRISKSDDRQLSLIWLRFRFRALQPNRTARVWNASVYSPLASFKRFKR